MIQITKGTLDCFSTMEVRKIVSGVQEILPVSLGAIMSCDVTGKLRPLNLGRMTKGTGPLRNNGMGYSSRKRAKTC